MKKKKRVYQVSSIIVLLGICGVFYFQPQLSNEILQFVSNNQVEAKQSDSVSYDLENIPSYSGLASVVIDENQPSFSDADKQRETFESYHELDSLGRCGVAFAKVGLETMPTEKRGSIGQVKPSGWHTIKYDIVDGKYLYNRCHLIGYQLTGENANKKNLITCTRFMNTVGMLPYENEVAEYVKKTSNHVLYRVTPDFRGDNLVANGVRIESLSLEDNGEGVQFNVYVYNIQDGIKIDYKTGESHLVSSS